MSLYKLYLDKPNSFQCKLQLEGASLDRATARVILDGHGRKFMFEGKISSNGECQIDLERLVEIFKDGDGGKMKLEVIADDTYFMPWESDFNIDVSKKVFVEVATPREVPKKPAIVVSVATPSKKEFDSLVESITNKLQSRGINHENIMKNRTAISKLVVESMSQCTYEHKAGTVIGEIVKKLTK